MSPVTKILFISADPTNEARLRLGEEIREVRERLQMSRLRDDFELMERHCVRPVDLTQAIFDTDPDIVHFSGHGSSGGSLILEDRDGAAHPISPDALEAVFALFSSKIFCVVLNACYSAAQAAAIARRIPYVVGMRDSIGDPAAITFSVGFYKAVVNQRSIEDAFQFGLAELRLSGIDEHATPIILTNSPARRRLIMMDGVASQYGSHTYWESPSIPGRACIEIRKNYQEPGTYALVDPAAYENLGDLLDELFLEALSGSFPPYAYGSKWVLASRWGGPDVMVIAPLAWAVSNMRPVIEVAPGWGQSTPISQGVAADSNWSILGLNPDQRFYGVATNNADLLDYLLDHPKEAWVLRERKFESMPFGEYDSSQFKYSRVFTTEFNAQPAPGHVFIDPGIRWPITREDLF